MKNKKLMQGMVVAGFFGIVGFALLLYFFNGGTGAVGFGEQGSSVAVSLPGVSSSAPQNSGYDSAPPDDSVSLETPPPAETTSPMPVAISDSGPDAASVSIPVSAPQPSTSTPSPQPQPAPPVPAEVSSSPSVSPTLTPTSSAQQAPATAIVAVTSPAAPIAEPSSSPVSAPTSTAPTSTPTLSSSSTSPTSTPPTSTPTQAQTPTPAQASAPSIDHMLITQVQTAGGASSNDFVKLYNPTGAAIDMSGWKLHKKSSTGTDYSLRTFPDGSVVASGGYFTWANSEDGFSGSIGADVSSTETLSADNSVAILDASATIIDQVAWGTGTNQYVEGNVYPTDPIAGQVLERKVVGGSFVDTDDNASDFVLQ